MNKDTPFGLLNDYRVFKTDCKIFSLLNLNVDWAKRYAYDPRHIANFPRHLFNRPWNDHGQATSKCQGGWDRRGGGGITIRSNCNLVWQHNAAATTLISDRIINQRTTTKQMST